jgi:tetratricopeptide (TPR) repeat protein
MSPADYGVDPLHWTRVADGRAAIEAWWRPREGPAETCVRYPILVAPPLPGAMAACTDEEVRQGRIDPAKLPVYRMKVDQLRGSIAELAPKHPAAYARLWTDAGRLLTIEAFDDVQSAAPRFDSNERAATWRCAATCFDLGRAALAASADPGDRDTLFTNLSLCGHAFLATGDSEAAVERFSEAIAINELVSGVWSGLADALDAMGQDADGLACAARALELDPSTPGLVVHRVTTEHKGG